MEKTVDLLKAELKRKARPDKAAFFPGFFRAYPGGYGEGDQFLGVMVPDIRSVARKHADLELSDVETLLHDAYHECRFLALAILVQRMKKLSVDSPEARKIRRLYLSNMEFVNNWDLVDLSCGPILGPAALRDPSILLRLSKKKDLWSQRASVITNLYLIKHGHCQTALQLSEKFLGHPHDLMHKACGWTLREVGQKDATLLHSFLDQYAATMPRTMLRYSIEKLPTKLRSKYMNRKSQA